MPVTMRRMRLDTVDGPFDLEIWRYEKLLVRR
jgi:hypothetical protein